MQDACKRRELTLMVSNQPQNARNRASIITRVAHFMSGSRRSSVLFLAPDFFVEDMMVVDGVRDASRRNGEEARFLFIRTFRSRTTRKKNFRLVW